MIRTAAAQSIPFLDLLPSLPPFTSESLFYDQCHATPRGNEVVAGILLDFLRGGVLEAAPPSGSGSVAATRR